MDTKTSRFQNIEKINVEGERPKSMIEIRSVAKRPKMIAEKKTNKTTKKESRLFQELNLISGTKSNFRN